MRLKHFATAIAVCATVALPNETAFAHARLKSASPAANATVKTGLAELRLQFNEAVEPALSVIELLDGAGKMIASSKGKAVCEKTACVFAIDPLKPGDYGIHYRVLSEDGHTVEATFTFKVVD